MNVAKGRHTSIIKPVSVSQPTVEINGIYAGVYYDSSYYGMKPSTEVLYRAAVVKELSQISDVLYVRFYVDGKDAVYEDGTIIGNMRDEDFVATQEGAMADVKWKTINLYFANKSGDALVKNSKRICYNKNVSVEKVVMEQRRGVIRVFRRIPSCLVYLLSTGYVMLISVRNLQLIWLMQRAM